MTREIRAFVYRCALALAAESILLVVRVNSVLAGADRVKLPNPSGRSG